jgi:hypothetical protein
MSKTTDQAIDMQNAFDVMEQIQAERDELAALEWIAKNPRKAFYAAVCASPVYDEQKHGKPDALHS